ncbi:WXG100 family type VII secretion target [Bacillus pseudomycoides]|uniref:WXG100 family type VII secretion target n=1 Tax=Bacillus pseudomycoides TaxID=64104 RepID=UPI001FB37B6F|nr:WXG100 family type VII secretion target [Bacillus pseudomycoides]
MEIKVKPEQLEQIAKNISKMQRHSQNVQQDLNQAMFSIQMQWQGATSQRFYGEYVRSTKLMERYIHNLQETEKDLRRIAQKFRQADEEYQKKQAEKAKETPKKKKKEEKSWWEKGLDEAAEFFGVNDAIRAVTGKDPRTGKELSTKERLIAAGWTLLNIIPVGKALSVAGKAIKYGGKMVVGAIEKGGKALLDGAKKVSSKLHEGVSFVASKTKSLADKVGDLWNKGKTKVKNDFIEADKAFHYAMKKLGEYVPKSGRDLAFETESAGKIPGGGKNLLKDAYQYVKDTGEKVFGSGTERIKFSEMTVEEQLKLAKEYAKKSPIEIPETAKTKAQSKNGYEQISYKWNDGTYKYEVRWHTRTPGAPVEQGNTWVIQRTIPGNGGAKPQTFFKIGDNEWTEAYKWYEAIKARKDGIATPEQIRILDKGHWKE